MLCDIIVCYVMLCYGVLYYGILCYIMLCDVMLCWFVHRRRYCFPGEGFGTEGMMGGYMRSDVYMFMITGHWVFRDAVFQDAGSQNTSF